MPNIAIIRTSNCLDCGQCSPLWKSKNVVHRTDGGNNCNSCGTQLIVRPVDSYRTALYVGVMKNLDKYRLQSWDIINIIDQIREIEANAIIEANSGYLKEKECASCGRTMLPTVYGNDMYRCCSCIHEGDSGEDGH